MITGSLDIRALKATLGKVPKALTEAGKKSVTSQAKLFLSNREDGGVINLTPPGSQGVRGPAARKQGENRVRGDIGRVYATRGQAYDDIAARDRLMADVFWKLMSEGNWTVAREVLRDFGQRLTQANVRDFSAEVHRNLRKRNGRIHERQSPVMIVTQDRALRDYQKLMMGRVGLLAAGWLKAASRLGVKAPPWIERHRAAAAKWGEVRITSAPGRFIIEITNASRHAGPNNLQRIADYALAYRREAIIRRAEFLARKITRDTLSAGAVLT
jgi:hypothetical protein